MSVAAALLLALAASAQTAERSAWQRAHGLGLAHVAAAAEDRPRPFSQAELTPLADAATARLERIEAELREDDLPEWAGVYELHRGGLIALAPRSGFAYGWWGCFGWPVDANEGVVLGVSGGRVEVQLHGDPRRNRRWLDRRQPLLDAEWFLVAWGDARYLIPRAQMIPFCNAANAEFCATSFPRRELDVARKRREPAERGLPKVPAEYRPFVLERPLRGALVEVGAAECFAGCDTPHARLEALARVDLGATHGLLPGMVLHLIDAGTDGEGEVLAVEEARAVLAFRFHADAPSARRPEVGRRVSTRIRDREAQTRSWRERLRDFLRDE